MAFQKERRVLQVNLVVPFVFRIHYRGDLLFACQPLFLLVDVSPWASLQ